MLSYVPTEDELQWFTKLTSRRVSGLRSWYVQCVPTFSYDTVIILVLLQVRQIAKHHCAKKPVTTMLTYPWKCTVLHCNHLGNTWKPLVLMTWHFDYCPSASEGDNQSVRSSAPVVSRCFPGGYNVKLYISRGRLAWWLLAFLCCACTNDISGLYWNSDIWHDMFEWHFCTCLGTSIIAWEQTNILRVPRGMTHTNISVSEITMKNEVAKMTYLHIIRNDT